MLGDEYNGLTFMNWNRNTTYALYNLRGEYKTLKGTLGHVDGGNRNDPGTINIYLDNDLSKTYPAASSMIPIEVNLKWPPSTTRYLLPAPSIH